MHSTQNLPVIALPDDLNPADVLRCAAIYIERHGLCKGDFYFGRLRWLTPPACPATRVACVTPLVTSSVDSTAVLVAFWISPSAGNWQIRRFSRKKCAGC